MIGSNKIAIIIFLTHKLSYICAHNNYTVPIPMRHTVLFYPALKKTLVIRGEL